MKKSITVMTVILCGLAAVCTVLLKMGKLSSVFSYKTGSISIIGKSDGSTAVFVTKGLNPFVITNFIKKLNIAASAAAAAFLFSFTKKIRYENTLRKLTTKHV